MLKSHKEAAFSVTELMFVVAIMMLLSSIALPDYLRSRKRSQALKVLEELRIIDAALDQYAIDNDKPNNAPVLFSDLRVYFKAGTALYQSGGLDPFGRTYGTFLVGSVPVVPTQTFQALSDIAPAAFWMPYNP